MRNIIELRIGITCARCQQKRMRTVSVESAPSDIRNDVFYIDGDAYRECYDCLRVNENSAHTIVANMEARRERNRQQAQGMIACACGESPNNCRGCNDGGV